MRLARGGSAPVRWLGHRTLHCGAYARPELVWPVRVRAGAFGPGLPRRDLLLSPDHAVFVSVDGYGDALVPVRHLVDGVGIRQEEVALVAYWHVELDAHEVILAEGMPAESYLDTGNRSAFANGGPAVALLSAFVQQRWEERACAQLVVAGPIVDAVRRQNRGRSLVAQIQH